MTRWTNRRAKDRGTNGAADGVERLAPTLTRRLRTERVGAGGKAVLLAAAVLAVGLAIHGYGTGGLAVTSINASGAGPLRAQPPPSTATRAPGRSSGGPTPPTTPAKLGPALSGSQYAQYAYRVYPGPVSASAQQATAGYSITTKLSGDTVVVVVSTAGSSTELSRKTYAAADSVYFIEANFGDDSGVTELNPGDDGLIVTNPAGLIVEG